MPFERVFVGACDRIPQTDGIVLSNESTTPASERSPIRTELYAIYRTCMYESLLVGACDRDPEADGAPDLADERPTIRTER